MRTSGPWIAFMTTLFVLVGLCGLFASFAVGIPLERALSRGATLDALLADPDPAARLQAMRPALGTLAEPLNAPGPLPARVAAARAQVAEEQRRESASVNYRVRLMICVVTLLAAALGGGIGALARKGAPGSS